MGEQWKPIEWAGGWYEVSCRGRVRSVERFVTCSDGRRRRYRGRLIATDLNSNGYERVALSCANGRCRVFVHRLVADHFLEPDPDRPQINHVNGDKLDNRAENLERCTHSENQRHASDTGLRHFKLTRGQALDARRRMLAGERADEVAADLGVCSATAYRIRRGECWPEEVCE